MTEAPGRAMFMSWPVFHRTGVLTWKSRESISAVTASWNDALANSSSDFGSSRSVICGSFFISERFRKSESGYGLVSFSAWAWLRLRTAERDMRQVWIKSVMARSSSRS